MGITSLIGKLFGADVAPPPDATKLDGTTEAALARSLSALPPEERGWITFAEARILFSTKGDQYAGGGVAQHRSIINFIPAEERVYFVRDPTAVTRGEEFPYPLTRLVLPANVRFAPKSGHRRG